MTKDGSRREISEGIVIDGRSCSAARSQHAIVITEAVGNVTIEKYWCFFVSDWHRSDVLT
jgi:hypothetical protein